MWKICLLVLYLIILSIYDCKEKQVPVMLLYIGVVAVALISVIELCTGRIVWYQMLGIIPGGFLVLVSIITQKAGLADGIVLGILGVVLGYKAIMLLFCISLIIISFVSILLLLLHKVTGKTRLPYLPFVTAALVIQQMI